MRSKFLRVACVTVALLATTVLCAARPKLEVLGGRLRDAQDFRVRVQAALELGRSGERAALEPLLEALDDSNASVRAAAAAALAKLGDANAVPTLEKHRDDESRAVAREVAGALTVLARAAPGAEIRVRLGTVHNGTRVRSGALEQQILAASKKKLGELPGVRVVSDEAAPALEPKSPDVMITTSIQKLTASRDGDAIVYSASIEYIVQALPDQTIMAKVSGSASAAATEGEARDRTRSAELRREVLEAAVRSALSRASRALVAAARL